MIRAEVFEAAENIYDVALTAIFLGAMLLELLRLLGIVKTPLKDCLCDNAEYKELVKLSSVEGRFLHRVNSYQDAMTKRVSSFRQQVSSRLSNRGTAPISPSVTSMETVERASSSRRGDGAVVPSDIEERKP